MVCDVKISSKELIRCKSYDLTGMPSAFSLVKPHKESTTTSTSAFNSEPSAFGLVKPQHRPTITSAFIGRGYTHFVVIYKEVKAVTLMFVSRVTSSPRTEHLLRGKFHSVSMTGILSFNTKTQDKLLDSDRGLLNFLKFPWFIFSYDGQHLRQGQHLTQVNHDHFYLSPR